MASATPTATSANGELPVVALADQALTTVEMPIGTLSSQLANWGQLFWYVSSYHTLRQRDLASGSDLVVARGQGAFGDADSNGSELVWSEHSRNDHLLKLYARDIASGDTRVLDDAVNGRRGYLAQVPELLDVDGDRVAYSQPAPRPDAPQAADILVRDLSTGQVLSTIHSDKAVHDIALSGDWLAFMAGHVDTIDFPFPLWDSFDLMLINLSDATTPTRIGNGGWTVTLAGDQLYWNGQPGADFHNSQVMTSSTAAVQPTELVPGQLNPDTTLTAGDGLVAWSNGTDLVIYDTASGSGAVVPRDQGMEIDGVTVGGGWLTWSGTVVACDSCTEVVRLHAIPIDDLAVFAGWT